MLVVVMAATIAFSLLAKEDPCLTKNAYETHPFFQEAGTSDRTYFSKALMPAKVARQYDIVYSACARDGR